MNPNFKAFGDYLQGESLLGKVQLVTARSRFHNMENLIFRGTSKGFESKLSKHVFFFFQFSHRFFLEVRSRGGWLFREMLVSKKKGNLQNFPKNFSKLKVFFGNRKELFLFCCPEKAEWKIK